MPVTAYELGRKALRAAEQHRARGDFLLARICEDIADWDSMPEPEDAPSVSWLVPMP